MKESMGKANQEPYLGRESVYQFDLAIVDAMKEYTRISKSTQGGKLSPIQAAACQIIPHGFSIALGIRELLRLAYLLPAEILLRPLIERAAVISYLIENGEPAVLLWQQGWPYDNKNKRERRPSLAQMMVVMRGKENTGEIAGIAKGIVDHFNSVVHADPIGANSRISMSADGTIGYLGSADLNNPKLCDEIALQGMAYLRVLTGRAMQIFPLHELNQATETTD